MFHLIASPRFDRRSVKFQRAHPELRQRILEVFAQIMENPFQPRLRLHALPGALQGMHAVSINYKHCIVLTILISARKIILLDIGSHDDVYR